MPHVKAAHSLYRGNGYVTAFSYIRFRDAPYRLVESLLPRSGRIMDLGCGYGFFTNLLGLASPDREVIGIELNERKLRFAHQGLKNVRFLCGDITGMELEPCDAIVIFHVLHHLRSHEEQERLLENCRRYLKPNGQLVVVEMDKRPWWKYRITALMDMLMYWGDRFHFRSTEQLSELIERFGFQIETILPAHRLTLPNMVYVCRKY